MALRQAMKAAGITNVALAARMNRDEKTVRRILAGDRGSALRERIEYDVAGVRFPQPRVDGTGDIVAGYDGDRGFSPPTTSRT